MLARSKSNSRTLVLTIVLFFLSSLLFAQVTPDKTYSIGGEENLFWGGIFVVEKGDIYVLGTGYGNFSGTDPGSGINTLLFKLSDNLKEKDVYQFGVGGIDSFHGHLKVKDDLYVWGLSHSDSGGADKFFLTKFHLTTHDLNMMTASNMVECFGNNKDLYLLMRDQKKGHYKIKEITAAPTDNTSPLLMKSIPGQKIINIFKVANDNDLTIATKNDSKLIFNRYHNEEVKQIQAINIGNSCDVWYRWESSELFFLGTCQENNKDSKIFAIRYAEAGIKWKIELINEKYIGHDGLTILDDKIYLLWHEREGRKIVLKMSIYDQKGNELRRIVIMDDDFPNRDARLQTDGNSLFVSAETKINEKKESFFGAHDYIMTKVYDKDGLEKKQFVWGTDSTDNLEDIYVDDKYYYLLIDSVTLKDDGDITIVRFKK